MWAEFLGRLYVHQQPFVLHGSSTFCLHSKTKALATTAYQLRSFLLFENICTTDRVTSATNSMQANPISYRYEINWMLCFKMRFSHQFLYTPNRSGNLRTHSNMHDENQYLIKILILLDKILICQLCIFAECYAIFKNSLKAV